MAKKAKRTIARHPVEACKRCSDPIEKGQAIRMWGGTWVHCYCDTPWLEGVGPLAFRYALHPQSLAARPRPAPLTNC